jgi:hypothetical protein
MRRRPIRFARRREDESWQEDPLSGVANLFDISLAFIVAMVVALFSTVGGVSMLDPQTDWTMTRTTADGRMEIVRKEGEEISVEEVTDRRLSGDGDRLGVAYRLPDGRVVYVPEEEGARGDSQ